MTINGQKYTVNDGDEVVVMENGDVYVNGTPAVPDPPTPQPPPSPGDDEEEGDDSTDDESESEGGESNTVDGIDSPGFLTREDIHYLSAIGVIKTKPKRSTEPGDYGYDKPGSDIWAWRHRHLKKRRVWPGMDGSRFIFEGFLGGSWVDWEKKLGLHDPGVVDPFPLP